LPTKRTSKRRERATKPKTSRRVRKRGAARVRPKARRRRRQSQETHFNPLMVFIMFLYMLRLMDEKQFKRLQKDLSPETKTKTRRRRHK